MEDTIAAISTTTGNGAISIIRVSGSEAIKIVNKIFKGKNLEKVESHTIHYGHIEYNGTIEDEVLVTIMKAPKTFTTEDVVEINCHGSIIITKKILEILLTLGCRLAEPGEFTKRAFLNGRIDLIEAEGIMDLINSKTENEKKLALNQISGKVSTMIETLRKQLLEILATIEVKIDYPEYEDIEVMTNEKLIPMSTTLRSKMDKIITKSKNIRLVKDGISTVIVGKPNVGKSSLLNALLEEDKAIVTDIAGTTRDVVEGSIRLDNIVLNMIDTAGIHETDEKIERMGVEKSLSLIDQADLVLVVVDGSQPLDHEDELILEKTQDTHRIIIINKADKGCVVDLEGIHISAKDNNIDALTDYIKHTFDFSALSGSDAKVLANQRQLLLLEQASQALNRAISAMNMQVPPDLVVTDLYDSWEKLKEILGEQAKEDLLDELFARFCIGK